MSGELARMIRDAGVIGAGGAGFPSHIKAGSSVEVVIANGAECEPLAQADQQLMERHAGEIIRGLSLLMQSTGAERGVVALKKKHLTCAESLRQAAAAAENIEIFLLEDYYPAGDEFLLVHDVTGRVISEGDIPLSEKIVVQNVGTLFHISEAERGVPVTHRYVSVLGEVTTPATFRVPVGTSFDDVIAMAGGTTVDDFAVIAGGPMMGRLTFDLSTPVGKTTGMLLVLPMHHRLVAMKNRAFSLNLRLTRATCTQCSYCTDLCPRYLLGHGLEPHRIMRSLDYGTVNSPEVITSATFCSGCGLCETYACVQGLSPRQVNLEIKAELARKGYRSKPSGHKATARQEMDYRKVPAERLLQRLGLKKYHRVAHLREPNYAVKQVRIGLGQHLGSPAVPVVEEGDSVGLGDLIADIPGGGIGARYHASVPGRIHKIEKDAVIINAA